MWLFDIVALLKGIRMIAFAIGMAFNLERFLSSSGR